MRDILDPNREWNEAPVVPKGSPKAFIVGLIGLVFFLAWQALWVRSFALADKWPAGPEEVSNLHMAADYRAALPRGLFAAALTAPRAGESAEPPLYRLAIAAVAGPGQAADAALALNLLALTLLCVSLFGLVWGVRPDAAAPAAALCLAASPLIQRALYTRVPDLLLTALVTTAYWALQASGYRGGGGCFKRWPGSILFGAACALCFLAGWPALIYLVPAFVVAFGSFFTKGSRLKVLAAAALALIPAAPWYLAHMPSLLWRAGDCLSGISLQSWRSQGFFDYFIMMAGAVGPLMWLMGPIGLLWPRFKNAEEDTLVKAWIFSSYVLLTAMAGRDARLLAPALPGLALGAAGWIWPKPMVWLMVLLQLAAAANYSKGWIPELKLPVPLPATSEPFYRIHAIPLLPSAPPGSSDWAAAGILETVRKLKPEGEAAVLSVVGSHMRFNPDTIGWEARRLGFTDVGVWAPRKRLGELAGFVVFKKGGFGDAGDGVPPAEGWFSKAFTKIQAWPLPDGSSAVLYAQKPLAAPPFSQPLIEYAHFAGGGLVVSNLKVQLGSWDAARGVYRSVRAAAEEIQIGSFKIVAPVIELEDAALIPVEGVASADEWGDIRLLKAKKARLVSGRVRADDIRQLVAAGVPGLSLSSLELDQVAKFSLKLKGVVVSGVASVALEARRIRLRLDKAYLGVTPLPAWSLQGLDEYSIPLEASPDRPFALELAGLSLKDGAVTIP